MEKKKKIHEMPTQREGGGVEWMWEAECAQRQGKARPRAKQLPLAARAALLFES
jgi:hypothetical protein